VALLGPNGAGKTTTTEILEGYRRRDAGEASVLGTDPAQGDSRWRSRIGIVLQSVSDLADLTVAEAVHHFAGYYPDPRDVEILALSGGQRRRLDVALGIIGRPELLFLDEPTTGFDPEARRHFWSLVQRLKDAGTTILLTTHYLEEAEVLADCVAVISRGRVLACDEPAHLGGRRHGVAKVSWWEGTRLTFTSRWSKPTLRSTGDQRPAVEDTERTETGSQPRRHRAQAVLPRPSGGRVHLRVPSHSHADLRLGLR